MSSSSNILPSSIIIPKHVLSLLLLLLSQLVLLRPACAQSGTASSASPPSDQNNPTRAFNPSMAIIMVVLVASFFLMGFFSVYVRQCTDRRRGYDGTPPSIGPFAFGRRSLRVAGRGLDPSVVESFPTFLYGSVKGHKINKAVSLECAVCLNEFEDEETLRLIPKCCHVFHPVCIDSWLSSHTTCPVCRADLTPKPGEVILQMPVPGDARSPEDVSPGGSRAGDRRTEDKSPGEGRFGGTPDQEVAGAGLPRRSRSTGMRLASMLNYFPRSHSTGHSLVRPGEDRERFTLRLPEEVMRDRSIMRMRESSVVAFPREGSQRRGYRAGSNRWGLTLFGGSRRGAELDGEPGETSSSDRLRLNRKGDSQSVA
ncbi:hypothetical protein MLD38_001018 [Melastoma candidum]|uniref:Uncharacterized protein n=1 Tax=Melastoma candidum TaxID=119954 RepID=A0ACB9SGU6_9MYRT|nr:hypothetical protein MLD38_001018 [Melastoma candidum]